MNFDWCEMSCMSSAAPPKTSRNRATTRATVAPLIRPEAMAAKKKPANMPMPPVTGMVPECCLRPPGGSARPMRLANGERMRATTPPTTKASSMQKATRFPGRGRISSMRSERGDHAVPELAQGNRLGLRPRPAARVQEIADAVVVAVLDRDEHDIPRKIVDRCARELRTKSGGDFVRVRKGDEERAAAVVQFEQRYAVGRLAGSEDCRHLAALGRIGAVDQKVARHARLYRNEFATYALQEAGVVAQAPVEHGLIHGILVQPGGDHYARPVRELEAIAQQTVVEAVDAEDGIAGLWQGPRGIAVRGAVGRRVEHAVMLDVGRAVEEQGREIGPGLAPQVHEAVGEKAVQKYRAWPAPARASPAWGRVCEPVLESTIAYQAEQKLKGGARCDGALCVVADRLTDCHVGAAHQGRRGHGSPGPRVGHEKRRIGDRRRVHWGKGADLQASFCQLVPDLPQAGLGAVAQAKYAVLAVGLAGMHGNPLDPGLYLIVDLLGTRQIDPWIQWITVHTGK